MSFGQISAFELYLGRYRKKESEIFEKEAIILFDKSRNFHSSVLSGMDSMPSDSQMGIWPDLVTLQPPLQVHCSAILRVQCRLLRVSSVNCSLPVPVQSWVH